MYLIVETTEDATEDTSKKVVISNHLKASDMEG